VKRQDKSKPNIVLVGFMGTGKTSVGKRLAAQLRMRYVDTDDIIECDSGRLISDIFSEDGEAIFRELESEAVRKVSKLDNHIISTGGGVVLKETNMAALKRNGIIFCLTATAEEIYRRVQHQAPRPLLQTPDPLTKINAMLEERHAYYVKADYVVETTGCSFEAVMAYIKRVFMESIRDPK